MGQRWHLFRRLGCLWLLGAGWLAGCMPLLPPPANEQGQQFYMPERGDVDGRARVYRQALGPEIPYYDAQQPYARYGTSPQDRQADAPPQESLAADALVALAQTLPLSPGDRVRVRITDGDLFNGDYEINFDGTLQLPYLTPLPAAGRHLQEVEQALKQALIAEGLFQPHFAQVSVRNLYWGPIRVQVLGAVFQPGQVLLNNRGAEERGQQRTQAGGEYAVQRTLTAALQAAGGVRPDADVQHISIVRGTRRWSVDLSGVFSGLPVVDPPLAAGDQVRIESTGVFQSVLVRPSSITPPGILVFLSNLTSPASSNSSSAVSQESSKLPYGTRLLQAAVNANCVGGTGAINSRRYVVLVSYNPLTRHSEVIERSVERLVRDARRDEFNPYLLGGDALACYDSVATNIRDIVRTVADVLVPLALPISLFK